MSEKPDRECVYAQGLIDVHSLMNSLKAVEGKMVR